MLEVDGPVPQSRSVGRTVWKSPGRATHVHDSLDCRGIRSAKHRQVWEYIEVPLDEVRNPVPCRLCFPSYPKVKVWHPICQLCAQGVPTPCPHNGAVRVWQERRGQWTGKFGDSPYDPDLVTYVRRWVWAENAWRYRLVDPTIAE